MKKVIYVGCSLTHASAEFKQSVAEFKDMLRAEGYEVLEFLGLTAGTSADVYTWDIHQCVGKCHFFVAICDLPSTGLGYELGTAVEKRGISTLAVAHIDTQVTRLVQGITHPLFQFRRYRHLSEVVGIVKEIMPLGQ